MNPSSYCQHCGSPLNEGGLVAPGFLSHASTPPARAVRLRARGFAWLLKAR